MSDWPVRMRTDLSLRWTHIKSCRKCCVSAYIEFHQDSAMRQGIFCACADSRGPEQPVLLRIFIGVLISAYRIRYTVETIKGQQDQLA